MITRYDENKDGILQKDEWSKMRGNPEQADKNKDGLVSKEELAAQLASYSSGSGWGSSSSSSSGSSGSSSRPRSSSSPSGSTIYSTSYRFKTPTERLPKDVPSWFTRLDADADGQVAMAEYTTTWSTSKAEEFFKFDLNADGVITPEEAVAGESKK